MTDDRRVRKTGIRALRVSAADVAREAGVSAATVSYVLNGRPGVSDEMRQRVLDLAATMGYPLERHASHSPQPPSRVLGLILTDITNPFYAEVSAGVIDAARARGYEVFVAHTQESRETLASVVEAMVARRVDGVVSTVFHPDDGDIARLLRGAQIPFIQMSRRIPNLRADYVGVDDVTGAEDILRHVVVDHGHNDIAVITGPRNSTASSARAETFVATAVRLGVPLPAHRRFNAYLVAEGGYRVVHRMLADDDLPRAVVCGSDAIASGVIGAVRARGLRVPEDVAVTGYDGVFPAASMLAELTTVSLPRRRMADLAVRRLVRRIEGAGGPPREFIQPHYIRIGTSCGCRPSDVPELDALRVAGAEDASAPTSSLRRTSKARTRPLG